jgi:predicted PurR-regulated permease PerM
MFAYDYPLLGFFWSMLIIFLWIAWLMLLFRIIADVFRNRDMSGVAKAFWLLFIIFLPFLGVCIYLIANGQDMANRDLAQMQAQQEAFDAYVKTTAGSASAADELAKLADLQAKGVLSAEEFAAQKARLLA